MEILDKTVARTPVAERPPGSATVAELRRLPPRVRAAMGISDRALQWTDVMIMGLRIMMDPADQRPLTERFADVDDAWLPAAPSMDEVDALRVRWEQPGYVQGWFARWKRGGGPRRLLERVAGPVAARQFNVAVEQDRDLVLAAVRRAIDALMPLARAVDACGRFSSADSLKTLLNTESVGDREEYSRFFVSMTYGLSMILDHLDGVEIAKLLAGELSEFPKINMDQSVLAATVDRLSEVVSSDARERVSALSERLSRKIQGASDALDNSADGVCQAANSLVEFTDRLLRAAAPDDAVLAWLADSPALSKTDVGTHTDKHGKLCPTKRGQALYFLGGAQQVTEVESDSFGRLVTDGLIGARTTLQKLKHADTGSQEEKEEVRAAAHAIEGYVIYCLRVGWMRRSDSDLDDLRSRLTEV